MATDEEPSTPPTSYEETHVHAVYTAIAPHFSRTRHSPWPIVSAFLSSLAPGSIGLDLGCGNGKNLPINHQIFILASDRSAALISIARQHQPHEALVADLLDLPHPEGVFDFAISIAVIHHLSTESRRVAGVRAVLATLKPAVGEALIFVWALEQGGSRRGWDVGDEQDVLVPWVMKGGVGLGGEEMEEKTFQRYYHLSREGELEELVKQAGGVVVRGGYERDNWWVVAKREK